MTNEIREGPEDIHELCRAMMSEELLKSNRNGFTICMYFC